ncbi:hydrolase [Bacillus wiedmannii]|uniref:hydrolase n=1 Tax=Bacillus wiedmannii TaxID=1890302 RepID=UPI000BEE5CA7|nr:hydrolase [Bacillus wiedmannii]PEF33356.1 hydrolase [Bacillus wiedmannii]PEJ76245.1 hydrolase [Bacillus wiedmannii]
MEHIETNLQKKIDVLGLRPLDDATYERYFKNRTVVGIDELQFKYYKMYGQQPMFYSMIHLTDSTIEDLVKNDEKNKKQFNPSFLMRLKRRFDRWLFRGVVRK